MQTSPFISFAIAVFSIAPLALAQSGNPQDPGRPAPAMSDIDQRFYAALADAAAYAELESTRKTGGHGGGSFTEIRPEGGILVGFDVWPGNWAGHRIIRGL